MIFQSHWERIGELVRLYVKTHPQERGICTAEIIQWAFDNRLWPIPGNGLGWQLYRQQWEFRLINLEDHGTICP